MIRSNAIELKRRIAVIDMPRPQAARLGIIREGQPLHVRRANAGYTTLAWQPPDNAQNWMSYIAMQQDQARQTTPGTLTYTPANRYPPQNVAPWNSWVTPNCGNGTPDPSNPSALRDDSVGDPTAAVQAPISKFLVAVGLLTAAASALYIVRGGRS